MSAEDIGPSFLKNFPLNGSNVQLIIDGWGTPVAFCRLPWQNYAINPSGAAPGTGPQIGTYVQSAVNPSLNIPTDPSDPRGLLCDASWAGVMAAAGGGITGVSYTPSTGSTAAYSTITTSSPHGLFAGETVYISSVMGATGVNGAWSVARVPTGNTFTIASASNPGTYTSGGTVSAPSPVSDPSPPAGFTSFVGEFTSLLGYTPPGWTATPSTAGSNPLSFILTPVIVSAGPDLSLGLDPTQGLLLTASPPDPAFDNIYSTQLQ
jgi:hypothetical protein